jgi:hypothetical protein
MTTATIMQTRDSKSEGNYSDCFGIGLPPEHLADLEARAARPGVSRCTLTKVAVEDWLNSNPENQKTAGG